MADETAPYSPVTWHFINWDLEGVDYDDPDVVNNLPLICGKHERDEGIDAYVCDPDDADNDPFMLRDVALEICRACFDPWLERTRKEYDKSMTKEVTEDG